MKPIDLEELSAYLDGELDARRMRELETAIASDPALRLAHQRLADADAAWRLAAKSASFQPTVLLPTRSLLRSSALGCGAVLALVMVRALPKLSDALALGLLVQLPVLIALMIWVVVLTRTGPHSNGRRAV
jgi:anti-sigma factor RsiW